jgi:threonine dehydratase
MAVRETLATVTVQSTLLARSRLRAYLSPTPLRHSFLLSEMMGVELYLKLENLNPTGSFKVRGALNKISAILPEARRRGVVTASAGNHGLGVAWAALQWGGAQATIFLPETAPRAKVEKFAQFSADLRFAGATYDDAHHAADAFSREKGAAYVGAFADADIVAGQGTIALEVLDSLADVDAFLVPVGGGGLISGIAIAAKTLNPKIQIIALQPDASPALADSLRDGKCYEEYPAGPTICDGLAGGVGTLAYELARDGTIDRVVVVSERAVHDAVFALLRQEQLVVEGSGAVGIAALLNNALPELAGKKVVAIISGGNIDTSLLRAIINERL